MAARFLFLISLFSWFSLFNMSVFIMLGRMSHILQDLGVRYAFVEFEDMLGVHKAASQG